MQANIAPAPTSLEEATPQIIIRERDRHQLGALAIDAMLRAPRMAGGLLDELQRAIVLPDAEVPDDVVGIGSWVVYVDDAFGPGGQARVQIVVPSTNLTAEDQIPALSSLGAALLGLRPGQSIHWNDRRGHAARLTVLAASMSRDNLSNGSQSGPPTGADDAGLN